MKTRLLFAAIAAFVFSFSVMAQSAKPETVPAAPEHNASDVKAIFCSTYSSTHEMKVEGWGGAYEIIKVEGTDVLYIPSMTWEAFAVQQDESALDVSEYEKLHFDVWVPQACSFNIKLESANDPKFVNSISFTLNEGWNTIDCDPAWWNKEDATYDWKDVKFLVPELYKLPDGTSAEGNPMAFTNIYWWKAPAVVLPEPGPKAPTRAEANVVPLFSSKYASTSKNFIPMNWGASWQKAAYADGQEVFFTDNFGWDAFANADWTLVELADDFDMFHVDIYVTLDSKMKVTFEALGTADGGTGWKNGAHQELKANQWNSVDIDLLNAPYQDYTFKDLKVLIFEGFQKPDNSSAEGTAVGLANAYFYRSTDSAVEKMEISNKKVNKRIVDGKLEIEVNGVLYNALGAKL